VGFDQSAPVRVLPGPHVDHFAAGTLEAFCSAEWEVGEQADRMGCRLVGPKLRHAHGADVASLGLPVGAVQVPGDGRPIVLLADHQPTGGYTVLACVIRADLGLLAQRGPGERVRFALTTPAEARQASLAQQALLQAVTSDDEPVWTGLRLAESGGAAAGQPARP
jgi:allophanate hydrolase subunit 2